MSRLQEILEGLGYECHSYSGKCMFGKKCLSCVIPSNVSLFELGFRVGKCDEAFGNELESKEYYSPKTDHRLGNDIIYWPNIPYEDSDE